MGVKSDAKTGKYYGLFKEIEAVDRGDPADFLSNKLEELVQEQLKKKAQSGAGTVLKKQTGDRAGR